MWWNFWLPENVPERCPRGHVDQIVRNGTQGRYQRYLCKLCGVQFRERGLIRSRARFPNWQVALVVKRYFEGLTYREAAEDVGHVLGTEPPDQTSVRLWVREYTKKAKEALRGRRVRMGEVWLMGEHYVKINKRTFVLWNVMDIDSCYLLVSRLTVGRDEETAVDILKRAVMASVDPPAAVIVRQRSSALERYSDEIDYVDYGAVGNEIDYIPSKESYDKYSRTLRKMKSQRSAQDFLDGWRINYNLFRPQDELGGMTPADAAGIDAPFLDWEDVVMMAELIVTD